MKTKIGGLCAWAAVVAGLWGVAGAVRAEHCNYCHSIAVKDYAKVQAILDKEKDGGPYLPAQHHSKWGYVSSTTFKMVMVPQFEWARLFSDGLSAVKVSGHWKQDGDRLIVLGEPEHFAAPALDGGQAVVSKWGFVNEELEFVVPPVFDRVGDFHDGRAFAVKGGQTGYIDTRGRMVIQREISDEDTAGFSEGFAVVEDDGLWGYMDVDGSVVIEPQFEEAYAFRDGLARVAYDGLYGFVDAKGTMAIEAKYEDAGEFSEGLAPACEDGQWGYIDTAGKPVIAPAYDHAAPFSEGLGRVRVDGKFGFVDTKGTMVIEPQFTWVGKFSDGLCIVDRPGNAKGFIDRTGALVIPKLEFTVVGDFHEGISRHGVGAEESGHFGYLNKKGEEIWASSPHGR